MSKVTESGSTNNLDSDLFIYPTLTLTASANVLLNSYRCANLAGGGIIANILTAGAPINKQLFVINTSGGNVSLTANNGLLSIGGLQNYPLKMGETVGLIWDGTNLLIQI
jgi:hypothetical protein